MLVYVYSPDTGEFIHQWNCQESPLEPGQYIIPGSCTTIAPNLREGFVTVFKDGAWINLKDHRNEVWYDKDTGQPIIVETITPADNLVQAVPKHVLDAQALQNITDSAMIALAKSDVTLLRCIENGVAIPSEWVEYRRQLRDVVNHKSTVIPIRPEYPQGS